MFLAAAVRIAESFGPRSIDVFEWRRTDIMKARLPNNPLWSNFASPRPVITLSGWKLAHAVVKADFLVPRNLLLPSVGFILQMDQILDFTSPSNLRLTPGAAASLNDVTKTSVVGRVGQGLSILFAHSKGYAFAGHLASDPAVLAAPVTGKVADFIFEAATGDRMILESKASFSLLTNDPTQVKHVLKDALTNQVDPWMGVISPAPDKGYAVYSCIRETGNPTPSALIFVDPPGQRGETHVDLSSSWVRRRNYAASLAAMGLSRAARRLRKEEEGLPEPITLPIVKIEGRDFAVAANFATPPWTQQMIGVGVEVNALRAVSEAIRLSDEDLMQYQAKGDDTTRRDQPYSVFPDGTFLGRIHPKDIRGYEVFLL